MLSTKINVQSKVSKTTEEALLDIGKYAIFSAQWIGYLPLTVSNVGKVSKTSQQQQLNRSLNYKFISPSYIWTIFLLIIEITLSTMFKYNEEKYQNQIATASTTENFSASFIAVLILTSIVGNWIHSLFSIKSTLNFWKDFCNKIDRISLSDPISGSFIIDTKKGAKHSEVFLKIQKYFRNTFMEYVSITFFTFFLFGWIFEAFNALQIIQEKVALEFLSEQPFLLLVIGISTYFAMIHSCLSCWIMFPVKVCTAVLEIIHKEIIEILEKFEAISSQSANENFTPQTASVTQNSDELKRAILIYRIDHKLIASIKNYHRVSEILEAYENYFGTRLIVQILFNTIIILGNGFSFMAQMFFTGTATSSVFKALSALLPIVMPLKFLYHVGSDASELTRQSNNIFGLICQLPHHIFSDELKVMIKYLTMKMATNPPSINPGSYFTVNRRMVTSLLSFIMTLLIVLVQFRSGEGNCPSSIPNSTQSQ